MKITKIKSVFQKIFMLILLNIYCNNLFAQGAWSIKYLPIDSLNLSYIGKEVRLDFKVSVLDSLYGDSNSIYYERILLSKIDTISLNINGNIFWFVEDWLLYPDHGSLRDQKLKYSGKSKKYKKSYIKEFFLIDINETSIVFEVYLYLDKRQTLEKHKVKIEKSVIKGFLINDYR